MRWRSGGREERRGRRDGGRSRVLRSVGLLKASRAEKRSALGERGRAA